MANPTFTMIGTNSFGLSDTGSEAAPVLADLDGDNDLDLLVGNADGNTLFFRNTGTTLSPTFTLDSTNPFGITNVSAGGALPGLVDIDGDGDLDLFIGNHAGSTLFFRNNGTSAQAPTFSLEGTNPFGIQNAGSYGAPSFADLDGDDDLDLLIGSADGNIFFYRNSGSTLLPTFTLAGTNPFSLPRDLDGYASPALADINGDGLVDLITKSTVYVNVGTAAAPTFSLFATNPYGNPGPGAYPRPALGDLDGDGDRDLVIGVDGGSLEYFRNVAPVTVTLGNGGNTIALSQINTLTGGTGTDVVSLVEIGATYLVTGIETLTGSTATDAVTLGGGGNTLLVSRVETLAGGSGTDVVTLGSFGNTMLVSGVETLTGGIGTDVAILGSLGNTLLVDGVETLTGGLGIDVVTLGNSAGNTLTVFRLETLTGGAGTDVVTFASGGNTLLAEGIETLTGAVGVDSVTLGNGGNTVTVRLLESLIGGSGTDIVTLGTGGNALTVRLMESIIGGSGSDTVTLGTGGNTVWVSGVETLLGGSGADTATLDSNGNTLTTRLVETLFGGSGSDTVTLGTGGNTLWVSGVETLLGGSGADTATLASGGNTVTVRLLESLIGGSGTDIVLLGTGGNTLRVSGIETLTGGSGTDVVTLLTGGNTLTVSLLESLLGAIGTDVVTLGSAGNTMLVSALETLTGGSGLDVVTVSASGLTALVTGIETLNGNSGRDAVTLGDSAGTTIQVSRLETLTGSVGTDVVTFGGTFGNTLMVSGIETLTGGTATDVVTLGSDGNTIEVSEVETLFGGSGTDVVTLGGGGNTLLVRLLETLTGGSGTDVVTFGTGGNVMTASGVETIKGGSGLDIVTLGDSAGNTLTVWRIETLIGTSGTDAVTLGSAGNTLLVDGVETVSGGIGTDLVELGSAGNTLLVSGVETLTGGTGTDVVTLGGGGNTLLVSGVETLTGGADTDVVTLGSDGNTLAVTMLETLIGGTGTDVVTFSPAGNQGTLFVSGVETVYTPFQTLTLNGIDTLIVLPASPTVPVLNPASDSGVVGDALTNASQPTLTGTADADSVVHLYGNGVEIGTGTADSSGAWTVIPGTALADGIWTLTARGTLSGIVGGVSGPLLVTIDTGASSPTALALAASSNSGSTADTLTNVTAPVITGSVAEAGVVVLYEGSTALGTVTAAAAGAWSITAASLSDGAHTLTATVTDAAGNSSSASAALTVTIDTGASSPTALALAASSNSGSTSDTLTNVAAPVITGSVAEAGVVVLYEGSTALGTVTAAAAGAWSITAASLSDGAHTLTATVTDAAGNSSSASAALTVTIDTGASSPTALALAASSNSGSTSDTLTNVAAPVITGSVAEAGVVVLYEGSTALGTVTAAAAGAWSITAASLSDGAHTLTATVTDAAGNSSSASAALTVTIDTGASSPTALALAASSNSGSTSDTLTNVAAPVITGSVAEAGVVVLYEGSTALGTVTAAAAGAWSITAASLSDGAHTLTATVTDAAGNSSSASAALTVTIDTGASSPTALALAVGSNSGLTSDTLTNVTAPVITGSVAEAGVVVLYEGSTALGTVTAAAAGAWSITAASLSDGAHTLTATVTDATGNSSSASAALTVTIDTGASAPTGLALAAASNSGSTVDTLTNVTAPVITGSVAEAGVVVLYEGSTALGTVTAAAAGAWSITAASLSDGAHTLTATVTDAAGNSSSASAALTVTIDTGASSPTALALAVGSNSGSTSDTLTNVAAPVITGSVAEAGVVVLYEGSTALGTVTAAAAGAWSITAASLSDGAHTLTATVTDAAGNSSSASAALTVTIDTGASSPTALALAVGSNSGLTSDTLTNVTAPVITGSVAEAGVVVLYEGSTALGTVTAAAAGAWSITAASLSDGAHTLTATVTDAAGNSSSASAALTVTIDTGTPSVAIALSRATLGVGETATVTFTFSEAPVGFSLSAVTAQNGTLSDLSVLPGSDGLVYTATLTPSVEINTSDSRITVAAGWSDTAGNTPTAVATSAGYAIDTRSPPVNTAPVIGGAAAGQAVNDTASSQPFATLTVSDSQTTQTQTVVVTVRNSSGTVGDATGVFSTPSLIASGFAKSATGTYTLTASSAAAAQAALRLLDFQPAANRAAPGTQETTAFTVTVTDADGASATNTTTSVNVLSINDAPVLGQALGTSNVDQGQAFSYTIPAEAFTDTDTGDSLTFSATSGDGSALPAWLSFDAATGRLSGTPGNADVGTRTVRVTATDSSGATVSDLLTIEVANVNDGPVAANDAGDTDRLTPVTVVAASGVLANDTDPDVGDRLAVSAVNGDATNVGRAITLAGGGRLTLNADGGYSFDPAGGYGTLLFGQTRQETVSYTVTDRAGATSTATLTITVRGVNTAPAVQVAKHVAIDQNSSRVGLSIDKPVDPEGDPLTITVTGLPTVGTLQRYDGTALAVGDTLTPDQLAAVIYTPPFGATGAAGSFSYAVSDGTHLVGRAVTISLTPVQWLSLTPSSLSIAEGNSGFANLTYTITRRGDTSGATTVKWQVDTNGLSGSIADAADFGGTLPSGNVTFAAGETSKTITVPISGDRQVEGNEQFRVLLFSPSTTVADAKITVETATATGTILNDDRAATITAVTGPTAGRYLAARGDTLDFTVAFSDAVSVSGTGVPRLALTIGTQTRYATFLRVESGKLVFRYAVGAGDLDNDGIVVAGTIDPNGAQIRDSVGNTVTNLGFGAAAPVTSHVLVNVRGGHAIDGYIAGATVFADANANGQLDDGEAFGTTNAVGNWSIPGGAGPIVMIGGTDISTNLPFTGVYEAPSSASVITPLTTIIMGMAGLAGTDSEIAAAATELKGKLGLDASLDLLTYDPIVAVTTAGAGAAAIATALKTQSAAASVANVIVQGSAVLAGVVIGTPRASGVIGRALVGAIADAVKAVPAGGTIDLADPVVIAAILAAAGARIGAVDSAKLTMVTGGAANVIAASNGAVITAGTTNSGGIDGLTQMAQAQVVAQGTAADELRSGTAAGDVSGAVTAFTGTNLQQQISAAQVAVVIPSRLVIAATDADKREGDGTNPGGTTAFTFTVTRAGNTGGALTVAWTVAAGDGAGGATLDAADFGGSLPSGTVSFADGEATKTITILVSGDTDIEPDETFTVTLSSPSVTATAIETASASGTIRNEDPIDPQLTLPPARTVVAGTATAIAGLSIMDGDSATVTVILTPGNGSLGLAGPASVSTAGDGTLTLTGSVADVNTTLASLVFTGAGGQTAGSIAVTVADGDASTPDASGTLAIAIQSPPANVLPSSPTLVAGRSTEVLGLEVTDIDGGTMTVVLTPTNGAITLPLYGSATTSDLGNGKVRLTGSLEDVNRTLQQLEFIASRSVTSASIRFESSDDQPLTPDSDSLLVIGVLSSPEHTAPTALSVISGVATAVTGLSVSDYDSPTLQVTLTPTNGALALTAQGGVTLTQPSAGVWRLLGTQADITATLATVTFTGTAGQTSGTIRVTTSDLGTLTTDAEATIAVTIADPATLVAPTLTLPQPITLEQGLATALAGIQIADPDSPSITVTLTPSQATLGATAAGQASVTTAGDGTMTISGSVADVNATLAALRITGGTAATATVAVTVSDGLTTPATGTLTLPMVDTTPPGSPTITAVSTDSAGTLPVTVTNTNRNRLFVRGTAEADSRVVLSDGGTEVATVTADAQGAWVADLSAAPLLDGTHAFTARATDAAGNSGPASGALSVVIDTVAPTTPSVAFNDASIDQAKQSNVGFALSGGEAGATYRWTLSSSGGGGPLTGAGTLAGAGGTVGGIDVSGLLDGTLSLSVTLTDAAGNVSAAGTATAAKAAGAVVDGTQVQTLASQSNGRAVSTVVIQAPAAGRTEDPSSPNAGLADVPLVRETVTDPSTGQPTLATTLQIGLPTGVGVAASGPIAREGVSLAQADLIQAIETRTTAGSVSRSDLSSGGVRFLSTLPQQTSLLLRTLAFTAPGAPGAAVRVTGAMPGSTMPTALVIDTTGVSGPLTIQLDTVSFAAVIGSATLTGGEGNQVVYGDAGSQSIILGPGDDVLSGGGGNDTVASTLGNDTLYGDGGDDLMHGGDGDDLMDAGADNDTMGGGAGNDTMGGGAGNDILIGEGGSDALFGGTGNDTLFGGDGDDTLFGEDGNDILSLGMGNDIASGGDGGDTLFGEDGNDTLFGGAGNDILSLGMGNDLTDGGAGSDTLFGEDGNDTLFGGAGDDVLVGGAGNDVLFSDGGADTLWGGAGADVFALGGASGGSMMMDFTAGTDRLALFDSSLDLKSVIASARVVNGNTVLDLRPGVSVTIVGQTGDAARWFT
ncbi:Ig-like domain-containing protein [Azospirillum brasilense]|uniref:Ig-like domain-containing protein n=1 Tax=Azospirillum brasilense TaxID=192 RepID=UPI001EDB9C62|nr:Ig-like domain-containing protein [Azospirillum brasilense]UKJ77297.1 tandem-95 repeat protein [Azospirillum brasilense]